MLIQTMHTVAVIVFILIIGSGCATHLRENPDIGPIENYDANSKVGDDANSDLLVAVKFPSDLSQRTDGFSTTRLRWAGLLVVNLKVVNPGEDAYLIRREQIEFETLNGIRYTALSVDEAIVVAFGTVGLYSFFFLPDLGEEYRKWGIREISVLPPHDFLSAYLFFNVGNNYENANKGDFLLPVQRLRASELIAYPLQIR